MKKFLLLAVLLQFVCTIQILAQSCFNVAAGNDTTIACSQPCLNLMAKVPDVRTTDDYQVVSIPYQPFPFINANGVAFNPAYQDDSCSDVITLPFTFCFYGVNYTQCVVGTNGILTFELSNANTFNAWLLNLGTIANPGPIQPIPYPAGGTQNNPNTAYYPRACIMGPYHDIDPQFTQPQMPRRKMEYIIVGTAPCRKFILNYNEILYFDCPSIVVTQQMVLYEGTGIIDIFIKDKPITCLPTTNEGRAILGIQNWDRDKAVVVNGRNNTIWSATNEGWRFVPNGTTSLLNRVELYRNGLLLSTGTTVALGNGELQATFANICQPQDSMSYTVKAFYKKCDIPAIETEGSDTIIVYRASDPIEAVVTNAPCFNTSSGLITITTPIGPAFEYSINGGTNWQPVPSFAVAPGNYTILSRKINTNCISTISVTVSQPTDFTATATSTNVNCAGNNGSITITATGGTPGYQYSLNNGTTYQNSNQFFNLLPGTYNDILVKDANNCIQMLAKTILFIDTMYLSLNPDTTICAGSGIILKPITNSLTNNFTWTPSVSLSNSSIKNPIASPTDTTQYSLVAQWGNCIRTANITLNVLRKPIVYAGKDTSICANTLATLKGTVSNTSGSVSYNWSPVATLATPLLLTTTAKPGTTQQYILTGKDNYGCNFLIADSVLIAVPPPIIPFAGNDTNAVYGIVHQLSATGGINYLWSPAGSLNNPFLQSPLATLYTDTYFTVVVSDATGCKKTDDIFVKVYRGPTYYVPNSFTPNGDNLNDIFRPLAVGINATEYFRIFNRYGQLIYQTNKWMQGWDGTYKGQKAPAGNYVWMIKGKAYTGAVIQMKGSVILLR